MHYDYDSEFVCGECFNDDGLKDFCLAHAEETECDFCGAKSADPIAAPLEEVIGHIRRCLYEHYDDPANAGLPYESREGGWQGPTYDTQDIFDTFNLDFPRDGGDRLRDAVINGMDNDLWTEVNPYSLTQIERLKFSWERFCETIKHKRRYFFLNEERELSRDDRDELFDPAEILRMIFAFAEQAGAFVDLPAGSHFYRARHQPKDKLYTTACSLGPPPVGQAIKTNRMSPAGVVMTYASEDSETALAETADEPGVFAVGEFAIDEAALLLDLTRLPPPPSVFTELPDSMEYDPRPQLNFLHSIAVEISRPIARDDRVHIEYVPTQVVTEYVRTAVRIRNRKVEGIRYNSSRKKGATSLVLFADQNNLVLDEDERPLFYHVERRWIRLVRPCQTNVTGEDLERWAAGPRFDLFE